MNCVSRDIVYYTPGTFFSSFSHTSTFKLLDKPWSQVSSFLPPSSCLQFSSRIGFSNPTSISHRVLLTHALALSASQLVHKKKSQQIYTSMHSAGLELTKLTYTRLEDNLIRHRGDRSYIRVPLKVCLCFFPGVFLSSRVTGACPVTTNLLCELMLEQQDGLTQVI